MNTIGWVVLGLGFYWLATLAVKRRGLLPEYIGTQGPILTIHTQRGKQFLDWLAGPERFWRAWGNFGIGISLVIMAGSFLVLLQSAISTVRSPPPQTAVNQPKNVLVIPGLNDFLPPSVAAEILLGLFIGLVVHEGGHGLLCRVEDIEIESMGIALLAFLPIGAFVEPDEGSRRDADRGAQTRMFAAGVTNNFVVTIIVFALLFGPVMASISVASGAAIGGVLPNSPAADADISQGDLIEEVNGQAVEDNAELNAVLDNTTDREVRVTLSSGETRTVERSVYVTSVTKGSPAARELSIRDTITAVNGTTVHTDRAFREALEDRTTATLTTANGTETTIPVGVSLADVQADGPVADAGVPTNGTVVITHVGGERVLAGEDLQRVMGTTSPGQSIEIRAVVDGTERSYDVTLGEHPQADYGYLGVSSSFGISGMGVNDFGVREYPASAYASLLGGEECEDCPAILGSLQSSFFGRIALMLFLPLVGIMDVPQLPFNFAGFTGGVANFYTVTGPLSFLGDGVFLLANVLFWAGWINVNLGFFNCIPAFPLDGGHILRTSTQAVVSRLPVSRPNDVTTTITTTVGLTMLLSLILMIFGPQLLTG